MTLDPLAIGLLLVAGGAAAILLIVWSGSRRRKPAARVRVPPRPRARVPAVDDDQARLLQGFGVELQRALQMSEDAYHEVWLAEEREGWVFRDGRRLMLDYVQLEREGLLAIWVRDEDPTELYSRSREHALGVIGRRNAERNAGRDDDATLEAEPSEGDAP